jgi:putative radical SAM enzyme (TIGR03279 family)
MKIVAVEPESIAAELGITAGDEVLEINGERARDHLDFRFHEGDADLSIKVARNGVVVIYDIEKDDGEKLGLEFDEMKTLACGNDCIFCFVDQNPAGLRKELYFRDGDYRLSFMYGNYTTMTNAGPAILRRIVEQRLSPQYISVHATGYDVRRTLMGLKKDDLILEKIRFLHDNGIDMHTQIVLCPGINDGPVLAQTVEDLYRFSDRIVSLAIVPVGLTDHRFGLDALRRVDGPYARALLDTVAAWQERFRKETERAFIYPSDEFFIVAERPLPATKYYDGFPQMENGVGIVRSFVLDFRRQARLFPKRLRTRKRLTLVTAELAAGFMQRDVVKRLRLVGNLDVRLVVAPNVLYGRSVTVAGLLSGKCLYSALAGSDTGDLVLLPPDILNESGVLLDDLTPGQLGQRLHVPVMMYDGDWRAVFRRLGETGARRPANYIGRKISAP